MVPFGPSSPRSAHRNDRRIVPAALQAALTLIGPFAYLIGTVLDTVKADLERATIAVE